MKRFNKKNRIIARLNKNSGYYLNRDYGKWSEKDYDFYNECERKGFNMMQLSYVAYGLNYKLPIDVIKIYADKKFNSDQMDELSFALAEMHMNPEDVKKFADPNISSSLMSEYLGRLKEDRNDIIFCLNNYPREQVDKVVNSGYFHNIRKVFNDIDIIYNDLKDKIQISKDEVFKLCISGRPDLNASGLMENFDDDSIEYIEKRIIKRTHGEIFWRIQNWWSKNEKRVENFLQNVPEDKIKEMGKLIGVYHNDYYYKPVFDFLEKNPSLVDFVIDLLSQVKYTTKASIERLFKYLQKGSSPQEQFEKLKKNDFKEDIFYKD